MRGRSNLLVVLGIAFFVVGGIIVFLLTDDDGGGGSGSQSVPVIVSSVEVPAGTLADDLLKEDRLKEVEIPADELVGGEIQSLNQLNGATFVSGFAANQPITSGGVQFQNRTFTVPEGFEAIAVQIDFVAGGAGYVNPGDKINLFGAYSTQYPIAGATLPRAELLLSNVQVLDVSLAIPARRGAVVADPATPRATGDNVTYLLAVKTTDAEKLVFATEFEGLYASLTAPDAPPAGDTPGADGDNVLANA